MSVNDDSSNTLDAAVEDAKAMLRELFEVMEIRRIVIVDDQYSRTVDFAPVVGAIQASLELSSEDEDVVLPPVGEISRINFDRPVELWRKDVQSVWDALEPARQDEIARVLGVEDGDEWSESGRDTLESVLHGCELRFLALGEWNSRRTELIESAKKEPTLFLFDQDMTENGGADDEGMKTIAGLLKEDHADAPVYFGLFSHLVDANVEHERHEEFANKYEVWKQRHRFAVISKQHLKSEPCALAFRLKRVAISPLCDTLKESLFKAITDAVEVAKKKIEELEIYDFEQIVFQSSYKEGVWEADTLLRLFELFHRDAARTKAMDDTRISKAADKVRSVIAFPYKPEDYTRSKVPEVVRLELYETDDYLLAHRMPIDVGDVFQKTNGNKKYILIEQPCDLMVRGDDGKRKVNEVVLAEVLEKSADKDLPTSAAELPFLSQDEKKKCYANMAMCATIPIWILDLCVFSEDGTATITIGAPSPSSLIPAWQRRYENIQEKAKILVTRYRELARPDGANRVAASSELNKILQANFTQSVSGVVTGSIKLDPDRIEYAFKRVARLKQPRAGSLLREFAYYKARDAFDHDLTRTYFAEGTRTTNS